MITLTVVSYNGQPSDRGLSARFDELGGTIGRADTNQLVLPDPDRAISRVHAQVVYRNGGFAVVDRGSNPIQVNGRPLGSGTEQALAQGDQVQIGGYLLSVQLQPGGASAAASSSDPFADLLGPAAATPARGGAAGGAGAGAGVWDPLSAYKVEATPPTSPGVYSRSAPPPAPSAAGGIPDDWDPFSAPAPSAPAQPRGGDLLGLGLDTGAGAPPPLIPELAPAPSAGADSLDALFGLKSGGAPSDPLGGSLLDGAAAQPNMAAHADPLRSLQSAPQASAAALQDDFSDLHRPFDRQALAPAPAPAMPPAPLPGAATPAAPSGAVLSWGDQSGESRTVIRPAAPRAPAPLPPAPAAPAAPTLPPAPFLPEDADLPLGMAPAPAREPQSYYANIPATEAFVTPLASPPSTPGLPPLPPPVAPIPAPAPVAVAPAAQPRAPAASDDALLAALREGLAMPGLSLEQLTPDLMRLIGQLLRESAAGTVDLLVARAALKREVRAEATMIVARENNPLKFSPSAEAALQHLLSPPTRGFMAAAPAMRDAFDDLRAHQFGFIAGMRAALAGVLERFDPAELEGRLTKRSALASLLPGSRKAAMWEVFVEHYGQISTEAEDDFHSLFGKAFLKAYEEHIDQLHKDRS